MISPQSLTEEWIMNIRQTSPTSPGRDPILIEKMILALTLVEQLRQSGLEFIFKGGTSLLLVLGTPNRFSIDIDIVLNQDQPLGEYFDALVHKGVFYRVEEDVRTSTVPKRHYKFFFQSAIQKRESYILLDILIDENLYPCLRTVELSAPFLLYYGEPTRVVCPAAECLLGDKLTAFAPHTTGVLYGKNKELEIVKQLFDIGVLFDAVEDLPLVQTTFASFASRELGYRNFHHFTREDVLTDILQTACLIGFRDSRSDLHGEYTELQRGIKKLAGFVYSGYFTLDTAILCAAKAAYLAMIIRQSAAGITRFNKQMDLASVNISNPAYNKLNKIKKISPEAFYYFYQAVERIK